MSLILVMMGRCGATTAKAAPTKTKKTIGDVSSSTSPSEKKNSLRIWHLATQKHRDTIFTYNVPMHTNCLGEDKKPSEVADWKRRPISALMPGSLLNFTAFVAFSLLFSLPKKTNKTKNKTIKKKNKIATSALLLAVAMEREKNLLHLQWSHFSLLKNGDKRGSSCQRWCPKAEKHGSAWSPLRRFCRALHCPQPAIRNLKLAVNHSWRHGRSSLGHASQNKLLWPPPLDNTAKPFCQSLYFINYLHVSHWMWNHPW